MQKFYEMIDHYDAFLCDLWGVIHDGDSLYPGVLEALSRLHEKGKPLVFVSNAPRLASSVSTRMDAMGVKREWYQGAVTSGEAAIHYLKQQSQNQRYYYMGLEGDATLLPEIPQQRVSSLEEADFVLNGNFEFLGQSVQEMMPLLEKAAGLQLPMLCINPDHEVIKLDGTRILCAGYLAQCYEELGGKVEYIGKPYSLIFELGMQRLNLPETARILMIGDNLMTDIKGGNAAGLDTAFVTQGILQNQKSDAMTAEQYCAEKDIYPKHIIPSL